KGRSPGWDAVRHRTHLAAPAEKMPDEVAAGGEGGRPREAGRPRVPPAAPFPPPPWGTGGGFALIPPPPPPPADSTAPPPPSTPLGESDRNLYSVSPRPMSRLLRCANGHEWHTDAGGSPSACPVCGGDTSSSTVHLATPRPSAVPTPSIAGYEILAELGRGGMGVVYKARDLARNRDVALKVILKERLANPEALRRFRREAHAAARLSPPNLP